MGDKGEKITVNKIPKKHIADIDDEPVAPLMPGTTLSVEDAKSAQLSAPAKKSLDKNDLDVSSLDETSKSDFIDDSDQSDSMENDAELYQSKEQTKTDSAVLAEEIKDPEVSDDNLTVAEPKPKLPVSKDAPLILDAGKSARPKKSHKKAILITFIILVVLLLAGGAFAYRHVIEPQMALRNYVSKLTNSESAPKTLSYEIITQTRNVSDNSRYNLRFNGNLDNSKQNQSLLSLDISGKYLATVNSYDINAETVTELNDNESTSYINIHQPAFIEDLFAKSTNRWLSFDSKGLAAVAGGACDESSTKRLESALDEELSSLVTQDVQRVGLAQEAVNGYKADHFRGKITGASIATSYKNLIKDYNNYCDSNMALSPQDEVLISKSSVSYDIWLSESFDKLSINVIDPNNNEFFTSITTKDYNTNRSISVPAESEALDSVIKNLDEETFSNYFDESNLEQTQEAEQSE